MQARYRMRKSAQFQYVYRKGKASSGRLMTLIFVSGRSMKAGFSVSKRVGGSVVRNYVKRRLREVFRLAAPELRTGSYVVVAKPPSAEVGFHEMRAEFLRLARRNACMKEQP